MILYWRLSDLRINLGFTQIDHCSFKSHIQIIDSPSSDQVYMHWQRDRYYIYNASTAIYELIDG
jgi:hypothetical protein